MKGSKHNNAWKGDIVAIAYSTSKSKKTTVKKGYEIRKGHAGLTCNCMGFRFKKGAVGSPEKRCKHIVKVMEAVTEGNLHETVKVLDWATLAASV